MLYTKFLRSNRLLNGSTQTAQIFSRKSVEIVILKLTKETTEK